MEYVEVRVARKMRENHGWGNNEIGKLFGVKRGAVDSPLYYKTWQITEQEKEIERQRILSLIQ